MFYLKPKLCWQNYKKTNWLLGWYERLLSYQPFSDWALEYFSKSLPKQYITSRCHTMQSMTGVMTGVTLKIVRLCGTFSSCMIIFTYVLRKLLLCVWIIYVHYNAMYNPWTEINYSYYYYYSCLWAKSFKNAFEKWRRKCQKYENSWCLPCISNITIVMVFMPASRCLL